MKDVFRLLSYLKPYWHFQMFYIFSSLGISGAILAFPWIEKILIDDVFIARNVELLLPTCGLWILAVASMYFFSLGVAYFPTKVAENGSKDIQLDAYRHLRRLGFRFYDTHQTGQVMATFTSDTPKAVEGFRVFAGDYFMNGVRLVVTAGLIAAISWQLCILTLALAAVNILIPIFLNNPLQRIGEKVQEQKALISGSLQESIAGSRELKGLGKEFYDLKQLRKSLLRLVTLNIKQVTIQNVGNVTQVLFFIGIALIFLVGGRYVLRDAISMGELFAITRWFDLISEPAMQLVSLQFRIPSILVAARRVFGFLDEHEEESQAGRPIEQVDGGVRFSKVSFGYGDNQTVLKEVSFQAEPGETVAVVGPSGAGKSTLINLIPRFYEHQGGEILIDSTPIKDIQIQSLRSHVGIVFQDPYLFADTVDYNIRLGAEDPEAVSHESVVTAAKLANAHNFIVKFPDEYKSKVGEKGIQLSGGEQQRIAIARVLIRNPKILILDEATSSLDAESEDLVQQALTQLMKGRTSFVIAHRLSTVLNADKILVLSDGKIVESGKHAELMQHDGVYQALFQKQFAGMKSAEA